ncbi:MAG TPA: MarR family transcriptional regulator [Terriglobia bacterium]|nr:MarR family transcriptional regulator [Terriglobia bacterium]
MKRRSRSTARISPNGTLVRRMAWFRYQLRQFVRFSEQAARACDVTPQHHQLLLGIAGYTGRGWATISELAEFLQERHNAVVGLVERAARKGLVEKQQGARDRRYVRVTLTPRGEKILAKLIALHQDELARVRGHLQAVSRMRPRSIKPSPGS